MVRLILSALGFGLLGLILLPVVAFFGSLILFHLLFSQCGTPGDSGGCEMSAAAIGMASAVPGFLIGAGLGVFKARKRGRGSGS